MKNKIVKFLAFTFIYNLAVKIMATRMIWSKASLTPEYLLSKGWVLENGYYVEPNIKSRDKIWVQFENHYYRVFHGEDRTYIALKSTQEWFDTYYLIVCDYNNVYNLAGI